MRARPPLLLPLLLAVACKRPEPVPAAPPAEFVVAAADSVFWIRSEPDGIRVRGAPMVLAQVAGRGRQVHPLLHIFAVLFVLRYVFLRG